MKCFWASQWSSAFCRSLHMYVGLELRRQVWLATGMHHVCVSTGALMLVLASCRESASTVIEAVGVDAPTRMEQRAQDRILRSTNL